MKRIAFGIVALILSFSFAACDTTTDNTSDTPDTPDGPGIGMTYGGKPGIDTGGIVIPFDGSAPAPGFGY